MTYKEFEKKIEDWGRKYNYAAEVTMGDFGIHLKVEFDGVPWFISTISDVDRFVLNTTWAGFSKIRIQARVELFDILVDLAQTPLEDRAGEPETVEHEELEVKHKVFQSEHEIRRNYVKAERFKKITDEMLDLYRKKNHDYGDSFGETYRKLGLISAVTRISDKVNRLQSLCIKEQKINDESIRDSFIDTANYCIMAIMEMDKEDEEKKKG